MSHSQFHSIKSFILRHAWLNLWDKRMLLAESTRLLSLSLRLPKKEQLQKRASLCTFQMFYHPEKYKKTTVLFSNYVANRYISTWIGFKWNSMFSPVKEKISSLMPSFVFNTSTGKFMHQMKYIILGHRHSCQLVTLENWSSKTLTKTFGMNLWGHSSTRPFVNSPTGPIASKCNKPYRSLFWDSLRFRYAFLRIQRITTRPTFQVCLCPLPKQLAKLRSISRKQCMRAQLVESHWSDHKHQHTSLWGSLNPFWFRITRLQFVKFFLFHD